MRDFRLPLTSRERELLLGLGISDLDLARRVRLPPELDGWAMVQLDGREISSLLWVACQEPGEDRGSTAAAELRTARTRIARVIRGEAPLPDPDPSDRIRKPVRWHPAGIEPARARD